MIVSRRRTLTLASAALVAPFLNRRAVAETLHEVQMVNNHPEDSRRLMVFFPEIVRAQPGDTIRFLSVDNNHNTEAFDTMLPDGAEGWRSPIGQDFDLTLTIEGAYGYFCTPHRSLGMVGLLLIGDVSANYEALKDVRMRGQTAARFDDLFERVDEMLAAEA